jgi:putative lumazine-binding protein
MSLTRRLAEDGEGIGCGAVTEVTRNARRRSSVVRRSWPTSTEDSAMPVRAALAAALLIVPPPLHAQTAAETAGIRATALDYVEGWYAGDGDRMARALHPELVKRILVTDTATGRSYLQTMGATALVNGTRHGYGKSTPPDRRQKDVAVLDVFGNAAVAKAVMADWIDYMQLARVDGRWLIVNVLWERKKQS